MKSCRASRQHVLRAVDQSLSIEEQFELDDHVQRCEACARYYRRASQLEEAFARLPDPPRGRVDVERAIDSIHAASDPVDVEPRGDAPVRRTGLRIAAVAAGLVIALVALQARFNESEGVSAPVTRVTTNVPTASAGLPGSPGVHAGDAEEQNADTVEAQLRAHLLVAFHGVTDEDAVFDHVDTFDQLAASIRRWPLTRLAASQLDSKDVTLARASARFLGACGDELSASQLQAALAHEEIAPDVIRALGDMGVTGVSALSRTLSDSGFESAALIQLARIGGEQAALGVEASLVETPKDFRSAAFVRRHLDALVSIGTPSVASLLRLGSEHDVDDAIGRLEDVEGAALEFARLLELGVVGDELVYEVATLLQPVEVLPWLEERASEHRQRTRALACIEQWRGTPPVRSLMRLSAVGWVPEDDIVSSLRVLANRAGSRLTENARDLVASRDKDGSERYLELLVATEHSEVAPALATLALSSVLEDDSRQWAALAVGALGGAEDARHLLRGTATFDRSDRRLFAACLLSIQRHLGQAGVSQALSTFSPRSLRRVEDALRDVQSNGRSLNDTVGLFRVARSLEGAFLSRDPSLAQSSL